MKDMKLVKIHFNSKFSLWDKNNGKIENNIHLIRFIESEKENRVGKKDHSEYTVG